MRIGICGAGNVGSALGNALIKHNSGYVLFYDVSETQLAKLQTLIHEEIHSTTDFEELLRCDVVFLCVPTERLDDTGDADLTIITETVKRLATDSYPTLNSASKFDGLIVQMSTCPPLTARKLSEIYSNYAVVPSYYTMGRMFYDAMNPVRILMGTKDGKPNQLLVELFSNFGGPMYFETFESVELTKYVENVLSALLISFWNEVYNVTERLNEKFGYSNVSSDRIAKAVDVADCWRSVYRFHGKAYAGVCLPKDCKAYIEWCLNNLEYSPRLAVATDAINELMKAKFGVNEKHLQYRFGD